MTITIEQLKMKRKYYRDIDLSFRYSFNIVKEHKTNLGLKGKKVEQN